MAKLTDTALTILSSAAARDGLRVLPLDKGVKALKATTTKVLEKLIADGLVAIIAADRDDESWRTDEENGRTTLVITPDGLSAIGLGDAAPASTPATKRTAKGKAKPAERKAARKQVAASGSSKQETVLALLRRREGASIAEIMEATDWQAHSVRGFLSGTVKTRMKLAVSSEKNKSGERRYRIGSAKGSR